MFRVISQLSPASSSDGGFSAPWELGTQTPDGGDSLLRSTNVHCTFPYLCPHNAHSVLKELEGRRGYTYQWERKPQTMHPTMAPAM